MRKITLKVNNFIDKSDTSMKLNNSVNEIYKVIRNKPIGINKNIFIVTNFAKLTKHKTKKNKVNNPSINVLKEPVATGL